MPVTVTVFGPLVTFIPVWCYDVAILGGKFMVNLFFAFHFQPVGHILSTPVL
jgi:hypothetical protein